MHLLPADRDAPSVARKLVCGALAGSIAQTVTYPLGKGIVTHKQDIQLSSNISFRRLAKTNAGHWYVQYAIQI